MQTTNAVITSQRHLLSVSNPFQYDLPISSLKVVVYMLFSAVNIGQTSMRQNNIAERSSDEDPATKQLMRKYAFHTP